MKQHNASPIDSKAISNKLIYTLLVSVYERVTQISNLAA